MTHIHPMNESIPSVSGHHAQQAKKGEKAAFEDALDKAFDKTQANTMEPARTNALGEISSAGLNIVTISEIVSGKTDKLLDMLDTYSARLQDPAVSLKAIAPMLSDIQENAGDLMQESKKLTQADAGLKKIASQTVLTAQTEYLKFQRGDYTS